jgi:glycosyltransferase involved in cell wall biosynthesis/SAM-dependent methyltransferase
MDLNNYSLNEIFNVYHPKNENLDFSYSDGESMENLLFDIVSNTEDISLGSKELHSHINSWPTLYHLTGQRADLLRPISDTLEGDILEIGCGCGAITRYLGELGNNVIALEGTKKRAEITASRCRDLENVKIVCDNFEKFQSSKKFDAVTLIGVLEYAQVYIESDDAIQLILEKAKSFLKPNGKLIIAIENQLGLKYFAGAPEDHLGIPFAGIENEYTEDSVITFGKKTVEKVVSKSGFTNIEFLYPFPDYKLPLSVLTSKGANDSKLNVSDLIKFNTDYHQNGEEHDRSFDTTNAFSVIAENGLVEDLANSFLIIASNHTSNFVDSNALCYTYSSKRKKEFCKSNKIELKNDEYKVIREKSYPQFKNKTKKINQILKNENYIFGDLFLNELIKIVGNNNWTIQQIVEWAQPWKNTLVSKSINISDNEIPLLDGIYFDATPFNFIKSNNSYIFFDLEWESKKQLKLDFILFRGLYYSLCFANVISNSELKIYSTISDICLDVLINLLPKSEPDISEFITLENDLLKEILIDYNSKEIFSKIIRVKEGSVHQIQDTYSFNPLSNANVQVFFSDHPSEFSEEKSLFENVNLNDDPKKIIFNVRDLKKNIKHIRFDIGNKPGILNIHSIKINDKKGETLFKWDKYYVNSKVYSILIENDIKWPDKVLQMSTYDDPQFVLTTNEEVQRNSKIGFTIEIVLSKATHSQILDSYLAPTLSFQTEKRVKKLNQNIKTNEEFIRKLEGNNIALKKEKEKNQKDYNQVIEEFSNYKTKSEKEIYSFIEKINSLENEINQLNKVLTEKIKTLKHLETSQKELGSEINTLKVNNGIRDLYEKKLIEEITSLKNQNKWYYYTYDNRSIWGILKDRIKKKLTRISSSKNKSPNSIHKNIPVQKVEFKESSHEIKVSVIIPTYNRSKLLPQLLECWKKVKEVSKYKFEIIFSDDGSEDGSVLILENEKELPLQIIKNNHGGPAKARNSAILKAKGEKLLIMGDDIFPNPNIINQHYEKLKELPISKAVLGEVIWHKDLEVNTLMKHITELGLEQFSFIAFEPHQYLDFRQFYTCNISIDRAFLLSEDIIFDESFYKVNFEDIELGYRLSKKDMQIYYYPEANGEHYHPYNSVKAFCKRQETAGEMAIVFKSLHGESVEWCLQIESILAEWNIHLSNLNENDFKYDSISNVINICQFVEDCKEIDRNQIEFCLSEIYRVLFRFFYEKGIIYKKLNLEYNAYNEIFNSNFLPKIIDYIDQLNEIVDLPNIDNIHFLTNHISLTIHAKDLEHITQLREKYSDNLDYLNFTLTPDSHSHKPNTFLYKPEKGFNIGSHNMNQILLFLQNNSELDAIILSFGLNNNPNIGLNGPLNNNLICKTNIINKDIEALNSGKIIRLISEEHNETKNLNLLFKKNFNIDPEYGYFYETELPIHQINPFTFYKSVNHKNNKKTIFIFPTFLAVGGVEKNTIEVIKILKEYYNFVVITFERLSEENGSLHNDFIKSSIGVYDLTELSRHNDILTYLRVLKKTYSPEAILICNGSPWLSNNTLEIRKLFNKCAIIDQQAYDTKVGWIQLYINKNKGILSFDRFIAVNSKIKNVFHEASGLETKNIDLIYSVLSIEKREQALEIENKDIRKKFNLEKDQKYFTFIGRMNQQKAPMDLIKLIKLIVSKYKDEYKFIIVGSGEMSEEVDRYIIKNNLNESIIRIPFVNNTFEISKICEGIMFTSLYEGLSIALLESLSVGTPAISTDVGDTKIVLEKFKNGFIFSTIGDIDIYFKEFNLFIENLQNYKDSAEKNKEIITDMFSPINIASQYKECFERAIKERNNLT